MDHQQFIDLGLTAARAGRFADALRHFDAALEQAPGNPDLIRLRADVLLDLGRFNDALAGYDRLAFRPATAELTHQRGRALKGLGRGAEAMACFDRALMLKPDLDAAFYDRTTLLAEQHRIADWFAGFERRARQRGGVWWSAHGEGEAPAHKARHDAEQAAFLSAAGIAPPGEALFLDGGARLPGPAIRAENGLGAATQWRDNRPQIVVVDDLLTDEALAALRRFCWGSTVWRSAYREGYLGAFPETGFAAPLLAQVVEEFRSVFSAICGEEPFKYLWGYKYDSSLDGIGIHADGAAVNVNFWITPDEANLDPASGGLVVWDVAAPLAWDFLKINSDEAAIRKYLAEHGAKSVTIPYRANRAVIFDSDLFHQTDTIRFRDGYQDRRINITLLYGDRHLEKKGG